MQSRKDIRVSYTNEHFQNLKFGFATTQFGDIIIASTTHGICYASFCNTPKTGLHNLKNHFPYSHLQQVTNLLQKKALRLLTIDNQDQVNRVDLHLQGTEFQLKVWKKLLSIDIGTTASYKMVAHDIGMPTASRAVGTACGKNPIAFFIPCHRVVPTVGGTGSYRWGSMRKKRIIDWESRIAC